MPWRIDFEGEVYREGDLTLDECDQIAGLMGLRWPLHPAASAKSAKVTLAACVASRTGKPIEEAMAAVGKLRADEFLEIVQNEDDDKPTDYVDGNPPVADEPSTGS